MNDVEKYSENGDRFMPGNLKNCQELEVFCHIIDWGFMHTGSWGENISLEEHTSMSRWDVYQKMEFLCETDWTFDIAISGLEVYKAGIGKRE